MVTAQVIIGTRRSCLGRSSQHFCLQSRRRTDYLFHLTKLRRRLPSRRVANREKRFRGRNMIDPRQVGR